MKSIPRIDYVLSYIDSHLDDSLSAKDLADISGYSLYHFCNLFRFYMGVPVMTYVRRRRLECAGKDLLKGKDSSWVAQEWGFETASGFAKAFRKHFGVSPSEFREKYHSQNKGILLKKERKDSFFVVGYPLAPPEGYFDVYDATAYWYGRDFSYVSKEDYSFLARDGLGEVGVWQWPDSETGEFSYLFGPEVKDTDFIPDGMALMEVPAAEYAVFRVPHSEDMKQLNRNVYETWKTVFVLWLEHSEYMLDKDKRCFEYYKNFDTLVYLPITLK